VTPAEILMRTGRLSEIQLAIVRTHAQAGHDILAGVQFPWPVALMALQHHERVDGSGYPQGLKGQEILLEARIIAVADVVESIASHRPYRPAVGLNAALDEIAGGAGSRYDPDVAAACLRMFREEGFQLPE
jgi:HD-GYP domain-containing protein (c-di-GMP phosphodiesterase class II)